MNDRLMERGSHTEPSDLTRVSTTAGRAAVCSLEDTLGLTDPQSLPPGILKALDMGPQLGWSSYVSGQEDAWQPPKAT